MGCVDHIIRCHVLLPDPDNDSILYQHIYAIQYAVICVTCYKMLYIFDKQCFHITDLLKIICASLTI